MSSRRLIEVPLDALILCHHEIGIHRGRKIGFRDLFDFRTLRGVRFLALAERVRDAYEGRNVPGRGWEAQRAVLRWFVDQGRDGIYAAHGTPSVRYYRHAKYDLIDGNHRALALHILGEETIRATERH